MPGTGAASHSSKPEYMPHRPEPMVANAARIKKPARPDSCRKPGLMSGVLTKKFGRKHSRHGDSFSSLRYSLNSALVLRQVK